VDHPEYDASDEWLEVGSSGEDTSPSFVIPRLWPIVVGVGLAYGSLFLPWIVIGRSSGNQEPLVPADSWSLLALGSLVSLAVLGFGFVQWRQHPPARPIVRRVLVVLSVTALIFTASAEIVAAIVPSVGSLFHVGQYSLTWSTGEGPWLALFGFGFAAIGIAVASFSGFRALRPGTALRAAMFLAFVLVLIGRNYSWFSIGWSGHHVGIPSWYIPIVGNDVRSFFIIWLLSLLLQWRWPKTAYTAILTASWTIFVMALATRLLLASVSLRTVDHLLGPKSGKFTTHLGLGLTLSIIGAIAGVLLSLTGLWQAGLSKGEVLEAFEGGDQ